MVNRWSQSRIEMCCGFRAAAALARELDISRGHVDDLCQRGELGHRGSVA